MELKLPGLDEEEEGWLWLSAAETFNQNELRTLMEGLVEPALTAVQKCSSYEYSLSFVPKELASLLQPYVLEREQSRRSWFADAVPPGLCLHEELFIRLTERAFEMLHQRGALPEWLLEKCLAIDVGL